MNKLSNFSWTQIIRLGLVQMSIGGIVVLTTSTLNRIMVVELLMPALLPGVLVAIHYAVQIIRPRMGFGSDKSGRCTPWIISGMAILCIGGITSTLATVLMFSSPTLGVLLALFGFLAIGIGVSASGTALLTLLAKRVNNERRASAATVVWLMMIAGFAITAAISGQFLDPFSYERLIFISSTIAFISFFLTVIALWRVEDENSAIQNEKLTNKKPEVTKNLDKENFFRCLRNIWEEESAKRFTIFIFMSMLAFSMQDLILEPFAGTVFGMTPGQTTTLSGIQHSGVLVGMILVAILTNGYFFRKTFGSLKSWIVGGCLFSAMSLLGLMFGGFNGKGWLIELNVFILGVANGSFSIAAIATMMQLAKEGKSKTEGTRIGLWGASQAIAFGAGGFLGAVSSDIARSFVNDNGVAYGIVFFVESILFLLAAKIAKNIRIKNNIQNDAVKNSNLIISSSGSTS